MVEDKVVNDNNNDSYTLPDFGFSVVHVIQQFIKKKGKRILNILGI